MPLTEILNDPWTVAYLAGAVLTAVTALIVAIRKTGPEVASIVTVTAIDLSKRLQQLEDALDGERQARRQLGAELSIVKQQLATVTAKLAVYEAGVKLLITQVENAGMSAAWHPPDH